jgi:hypothetical protein
MKPQPTKENKMLLDRLNTRISVSTTNSVAFQTIATPTNWEKAIEIACRLAPQADVEIRTNDLSVIEETIGKKVRPGVYRVTWLDLIGRRE